MIHVFRYEKWDVTPMPLPLSPHEIFLIYEFQ